MRIDTALDGGAIDVLEAGAANDVALAFRPDTANDRFRQWFHFRVRGAPREELTMRIVNLEDATYPDAFEGYRACASYDGVAWFRVPTEVEDGALVIRHAPEKPTALYAYFAAYTEARRKKLLARAKTAARIETLGTSVQGRPITMLTLGDDDGSKRRIWIQARQHPGETMAEWFAEGAILRLMDRRDEVTKRLLEHAVVHVIPCVNPDGGVLGNLRTNAAGVDLNRAWIEPEEATSPEVLVIREALRARGVDLFLDVHGDERNPYIFAAGCEGNPSYDERIDALEDLFMDSLVSLDGDFQREYGYERDAPGAGDLSCASNWVGEEFGCLSLTLEMPFKDNANHPDPTKGWSPERAMHFGRTTLESVLVCLDALRLGERPRAPSCADRNPLLRPGDRAEQWAMNQFVQIPCGKCGTTVWISPAAGVGYCPQCHSPNQLPAGAAGAAAPQGAPQPGAQPGANPYGAPPGAPGASPYGGGMSVPAGMTGVVGKNPGLPTGKIVMAVAGAIGIAILGIGGTIVKGMLKGGEKSVSSLGIEEKKADPDKMITAVAPLAKSWKSDAVFWSVNVIGLGPDGTVDLSKSDSVVTVEYISPSRVTATLSKMREDSIKKFAFNGSKVRYADKWNATNQWKNVSPTPVPGCSFKQIASVLSSKGLKPGHTAHVSLDPQFGEVIHAMADDPHIDLRFDPATCKPL